MKLPVRILMTVLCIALIAVMPFMLSSPYMIGEVKAALMNGEEDEGEELDFASLIFASAFAEEAEVLIEEEIIEGEESALTALYELPVDFTVPPAPDPECFSENSYADGSIEVDLETVEGEGFTWCVAKVRIASPTQLRTATAGKLTSNKTAKVTSLAEKNNAVIAINGDNYVDNPQKTTFEYRMGQKIRSKSNRTKDVLIIDENGDFHLFIKSEGLKDYDGEIINAMTFGPALVKDGERLTMDMENYGYNPNGKQPRAAIGQTGPLSYVLVVIMSPTDEKGVNHQQLADFMYDLGCIQAFNLDGGNSAGIVFNGTLYKGAANASERALSDILYFATAIPE